MNSFKYSEANIVPFCYTMIQFAYFQDSTIVLTDCEHVCYSLYTCTRPYGIHNKQRPKISLHDLGTSEIQSNNFFFQEKFQSRQ